MESLRWEIQAEQRRAEGELEREQAQLHQQYSESKDFTTVIYFIYKYHFLSQYKVESIKKKRCLPFFYSASNKCS